MISRGGATDPKRDIWGEIAAPLPPSAIQWRQDGKATARDGKFFARFVAYIDAHFIRMRLDAVVPGEWDSTLELLPSKLEGVFAFKCRMQILGVIREDVGEGDDFKTAATDAFKRAAVRFGVAAELYDYGQNWVQVDGDGKFAKALEDPAEAYARRQARVGTGPRRATVASEPTPALEVPAPTPVRGSNVFPDCPTCGGTMWDNRATKRNPKAPDFKCKNKSCDGAVWPKREGAAVATAPVDENEFPPALEDEQDDLPF